MTAGVLETGGVLTDGGKRGIATADTVRDGGVTTATGGAEALEETTGDTVAALVGVQATGTVTADAEVTVMIALNGGRGATAETETETAIDTMEERRDIETIVVSTDTVERTGAGAAEAPETTDAAMIAVLEAQEASAAVLWAEIRAHDTHGAEVLQRDDWGVLVALLIHLTNDRPFSLRLLGQGGEDRLQEEWGEEWAWEWGEEGQWVGEEDPSAEVPLGHLLEEVERRQCDQSRTHSSTVYTTAGWLL